MQILLTYINSIIGDCLWRQHPDFEGQLCRRSGVQFTIQM